LVAEPLTLKPRGRKPPLLGPKVPVAVVHLLPAADDAGLSRLCGTAGLADTDKDGLLEQNTDPQTMWLGSWTNDLALEFELAAPTPLGAVVVWNYNAVWQATNGVRKADVSVSSDGNTWQTILRGVDFAKASNGADYDTPVVLKLEGVTARKVRIENIEPWSTDGKVGLSKVLLYQPVATAQK
jgi:hypothetical protein